MKSLSDMRPYQHRMSDFMVERPNCAVWAAMGIGKSVATLTAINRMVHSFDIHRTLIGGPLRVARKVWTDEIMEWSHLNKLTATVVCGPREYRIKALKRDTQIHLINHENMPWLCKRYIEQNNRGLKQIRHWPWDTVILDESDWYKSPSAQRVQWLERCRRLFPRMIQLTGTPVPNDYFDVYAQIHLLDGGARLGATQEAFKTRWMDPPGYGEHKSKMKPYAELEIKKLISDIVISLRSEDYLDLPPIMNNFIRVELPRKAKEMYDELEREFIVELFPDKVVTAVNGGALYSKLLQMAGGAVYRAIDEVGTKETLFLHQAKIEALLEIVGSLPKPIILAYGFKHERDRIYAAFAKYMPALKVRPLKTIADEVAWNAGEIEVLTMHPKSGGHGLNLQYSGSENIIWFGPTPNRGLYDQLNARLAGGHRRVGKNIVIHHIIAEDTIDMLDVIPRLDLKGSRQERLMKLLSEKVEKVYAQKT